MTQRAYTVAELDNLRRLVENKYLFGSYVPRGSGISSSYMANEKEKAVEERVRTHMLAGHTAEDLISAEKEQQAARLKAFEEMTNTMDVKS